MEAEVTVLPVPGGPCKAGSRGRRGAEGRAGNLNETDRLLQHAFDGVHLGVVELRKTRSREPRGDG